MMSKEEEPDRAYHLEGVWGCFWRLSKEVGFETQIVFAEYVNRSR